MKSCLKMKKGKPDIVHCSIVGDSLVGKTSLIQKFLGEESTNKHTATVFDNFAGDVTAVGSNYTVSVFDTTGKHEFGGLRYLPYSESNIIIVCYSVTDRSSFNNISKFWIHEVRKHSRKSVPIILVATNCDLADGKGRTVRRSEGLLLSKNIGAFKMVETSMYDLNNITKLFEIVVTKALCKKRNIIKKLFRM